jgi:hypothetical protein
MAEEFGTEATTVDTPEALTALVLRPTSALTADAVAPADNRLPARLARRLPELWQGGRGPLARAVVASSLVALGAVAGRMAATSAVTLAPTGRLHPAVPPRRVTITIETELGERTSRAFGRSTTRWGRRRVQVVQEFPGR